MAKETIKVVGLSFRPTQVVLKPNYKVRLIPEPDNKFDPNAVKVQDLSGNMLGYIGKDSPVRPQALKAEKPLELRVTRVNYHKEGDKLLWKTVKIGDMVQLWLEAEIDTSVEQDSTFAKITSFTGEEVLWSEFRHECLDMKGNKLKGGSTYSQEVRGNFSFDKIATAYAKKNDLKKEEVIEYWESLKDIAGSYGTSIHKAMEHYGKFEPIVGHEQALPRQVHTREAVEKFLEISDMKNCEIEPLITDVEKGMSGWIDLLRFVGDKRVWIEDYKTAEADPVKWRKKLKEYVPQLNYYGTILKNHGYVVEKLIIWHWTGEYWESDTIPFTPVEEYVR